MSEDIRGFSLPFRIDPATGGVAAASGLEKLKQNITHILLTSVGERAMLRDYGGGIRQLVHDPNNEALRAIVQHQIMKTISQWEPRVTLESVTVTQQEGELLVVLQYTIRRTSQPQSLSVALGLGGI